MNRALLEIQPQPMMKPYVNSIAYLAVIIVLAAAPVNSFADTVEISGRTMGPIQYRVVLHDVALGSSQQEIADAIQAELDRVNQLMSTYIDDSDVSRFNQASADEWVSVDRETVTVVIRAAEISQLTDGAFDITVGPAVNLWNFGPNKQEFKIPEDAAIEAVKPLIGYQKVETRVDPPALKKSVDKLEIDLSAIAKGYAVDVVHNKLMELGFENFLVEVGGEVRCRGNGPKGDWRIGIESPDGSSRDVVNISGKSVATSGDYRNFEMVDGVRYSHAIDPRTCRPVTNKITSASVIAEDCMTADAVATAVMVLGSEPAFKLSVEMGLQMLISARGETQILSENTPGFPFQSKVAKAATKPVAPESSIWPAFFGALIVFTLVVLGMSVGAIFNNKPVRGSCGGLATADDGSCTVCSKPSTDCVEEKPTSTAD